MANYENSTHTYHAQPTKESRSAKAGRIFDAFGNTFEPAMIFVLMLLIAYVASLMKN